MTDGPNRDHDDPNGEGELIASDQHPDHDVRAGEQFIATVYNAIRQNPNLWPNTAILVVQKMRRANG